MDPGPISSAIIAFKPFARQFPSAAIGIFQRPRSDAVHSQLVFQSLKLLAQVLHCNDANTLLRLGIEKVARVKNRSAANANIRPEVTGAASAVECALKTQI